MQYSELSFDLQFTDKTTTRFTFSPLDTEKTSNIENNIRNFNAILKDEEPSWYEYIANEDDAKVDTDVGIVSAEIINYNVIKIL